MTLRLKKTVLFRIMLFPAIILLIVRMIYANSNLAPQKSILLKSKSSIDEALVFFRVLNEEDTLLGQTGLNDKIKYPSVFLSLASRLGLRPRVLIEEELRGVRMDYVSILRNKNVTQCRERIRDYLEAYVNSEGKEREMTMLLQYIKRVHLDMAFREKFHRDSLFSFLVEEKKGNMPLYQWTMQIRQEESLFYSFLEFVPVTIILDNMAERNLLPKDYIKKITNFVHNPEYGILRKYKSLGKTIRSQSFFSQKQIDKYIEFLAAFYILKRYKKFLYDRKNDYFKAMFFRRQIIEHIPLREVPFWSVDEDGKVIMKDMIWLHTGDAPPRSWHEGRLMSISDIEKLENLQSRNIETKKPFVAGTQLLFNFDFSRPLSDNIRRAS